MKVKISKIFEFRDSDIRILIRNKTKQEVAKDWAESLLREDIKYLDDWDSLPVGYVVEVVED